MIYVELNYKLNHLDLYIINKSIVIIAAILSTIGTALGTTQGSCLPLA